MCDNIETKKFDVLMSKNKLFVLTDLDFFKRGVIMKRVLFLVFFLLLFLVVNAQEPISFRSRALGGAIDDDADLIYDPIELRFVDGFHLYTNLSNFTSNNEQFINNVSDNEFLLGSSLKNPFLKNLWTSFLWRFRNTKTPWAVAIDEDLNGTNDIFGNGELTSNYVKFFDTDNDGFYEQKRTILQKIEDSSNWDGNNFVFNNSYGFDTFTVGAKIAFGSEKFKSNESSNNFWTNQHFINFGDPSFDIDFADYDLDNQEDLITYTEKGSFSNEDDEKFTLFNIAFMMPEFMGYELRGDFVYRTFSEKEEVRDKFNYTEIDKTGTDTITEQENESIEEDTEESGNVMSLGVSVRKNIGKNNDRKNSHFWQVGCGFGFGSGDYTNNMTHKSDYIEETPNWAGGTEKRVERHDITVIEEDEGDLSLSRFGLFARYNYPINKRVIFGIGSNYTSQKTKRETDYLDSYYEYESDIIGSFDDPGDTKETWTRDLNANRTFEVTFSEFEVPFGIEYKFTKNEKWAFRVGSNFTKTCVKEEDKKDYIYTEQQGLWHYVLEHGDGQGDIDEYHDDFYTSESEIDETTDSITMYSYGIGYQPTENLQIDFLGMFDNAAANDVTQFFRNLRISFMLKF